MVKFLLSIVKHSSDIGQDRWAVCNDRRFVPVHSTVDYGEYTFRIYVYNNSLLRRTAS